MASGREVLAAIDDRVDALRAAAAERASQVEQAMNALNQAHSTELRHTQELARLRVDLLASRQMIEGLDQADRRALELIETRDRNFARLGNAITASLEAQRALVEQRNAALAARDAAAAALDERTARTQARLRADPAWREREATAEALLAQAERAERKAAQAAADRAEKRKPYEADRLFMYLWQRRFAFADYRGSGLTRAIDRWMARRIGYDKAQRNYRLLLDLADRLAAHAARLRADAEARASALAADEESALLADGAAPLRERLAAVEATLAEVSAALEAEEQRHRTLVDERAAIAAGEDALTQEAVQLIESQMARESTAQLMQDARATASPRDDSMVQRLADLRTKVEVARQQVERLRREQRAALAQVATVEELRKRYRAKHFDSGVSDFEPGFDVGALLTALLGGTLDLDRAWREVKRWQRWHRRSNPTWRGSGMLTGGGARAGGGPSGGGVFRTGGGVGGGGGFRTGGGF